MRQNPLKKIVDCRNRVKMSESILCAALTDMLSRRHLKEDFQTDPVF